MMRMGLGLALAPTSAYAVSVSANDGSGSQHRTASYANGADVTGTLKSTSGKTVYYSGKVALGFGCSDEDSGRYSGNTFKTTAVPAGGRISASIAVPCTFQGVKSRVCTIRNTFPDACGSDSDTY